MIPQELKKRKKLANTCNQAIVPPLGTLPILLADSLFADSLLADSLLVLGGNWRRE
jgi:hypothetical protein